MSWDPIWEEIFSSQEWGKYPGEPLIKFVARNFYKLNRSEIDTRARLWSRSNSWFCAREGFRSSVSTNLIELLISALRG